ncbi:GNAT family N-acetyltransferase [Defluviimonas sp. SAOS-178_SWC]|uniref:GNAT family N-acetyltransferase n=1 Tax=Defluviimonas sp. SAOS-178_SWC TaxID=3121287 RepID=UPI003221CD9C
MRAFRAGRYEARLAETEDDIRRAQGLRWRAFRAARGRGKVVATDADSFDAICRHVLVEDRWSGAPVAAFRLLDLRNGAEAGRSYSAQFYDLSALAAYPGRMVEMGRFCLDPEWHDPDILRVAWGAMARHVDEERVEMLFGCSSFQGTDVEAHLDAFALLCARHLGPERWLPKEKAPDLFRFAARLRGRVPDRRRAMQGLPPLLRSYVAMGGWVSDHAVVDPDLGTIHVFTALEVNRIPAARARTLRGVAESCL